MKLSDDNTFVSITIRKVIMKQHSRRLSVPGVIVRTSGQNTAARIT